MWDHDSVDEVVGVLKPVDEVGGLKGIGDMKGSFDEKKKMVTYNSQISKRRSRNVQKELIYLLINLMPDKREYFIDEFKKIRSQIDTIVSTCESESNPTQKTVSSFISQGIWKHLVDERTHKIEDDDLTTDATYEHLDDAFTKYSVMMGLFTKRKNVTDRIMMKIFDMIGMFYKSEDVIPVQRLGQSVLRIYNRKKRIDKNTADDSREHATGSGFVFNPSFPMLDEHENVADEIKKIPDKVVEAMKPNDENENDDLTEKATGDEFASDPKFRILNELKYFVENFKRIRDEYDDMMRSIDDTEDDDFTKKETGRSASDPQFLKILEETKRIADETKKFHEKIHSDMRLTNETEGDDLTENATGRKFKSDSKSVFDGDSEVTLRHRNISSLQTSTDKSNNHTALNQSELTIYTDDVNASSKENLLSSEKDKSTSNLYNSYLCSIFIPLIMVTIIVIASVLLFYPSSKGSLTVSVFYASICIDSVNFITKQLAPNYDAVAENIIIDFVPYGKANHTLVNGSWQFECQHGKDECYGNMMQACGLKEIDDQATKVKFINCVMSARYPPSNGTMEKCANSNGISWENMVMCTKNGEGAKLMVDYGNRTHNVKPKITFIPTIIYNDVYDEDLQEKSLVNFLKTVKNQV